MKSYIDETIKPPISFGCIDGETGEFKKGYIDKSGNMKYKNPLPWYKKIFGKKEIHDLWGSPEYVGYVSKEFKLIGMGIFNGGQNYGNYTNYYTLYKEKNKFNNKYRYYMMFNGKLYSYIDSNAYEKNGLIIEI